MQKRKESLQKRENYTTDEHGSTTLITNTTDNVCNEYFYQGLNSQLGNGLLEMT